MAILQIIGLLGKNNSLCCQANYIFFTCFKRQCRLSLNFNFNTPRNNWAEFVWSVICILDIHRKRENKQDIWSLIKWVSKAHCAPAWKSAGDKRPVSQCLLVPKSQSRIWIFAHQWVAENFILFCFCLWLQNHTRTTFFFRSNFSAIAAIFSEDGRGCTAKYASRDRFSGAAIEVLLRFFSPPL